MKVEGERNRKLEIEIDPRSVAVVTTTFYPNWYPGSAPESKNSDKVRGDLALRMLSEARGKSFQLVVVDGANNQMFKEALRRIDTNPLPETERGMSASRQQGFKEAHILEGVKVICWLEPEKVSISRDCLPEAVIPILKGETDIVVPKRNEDLFKETYPDYQVKFEQDSNRIWNAILRKYGLRSKSDPDLDVWFGPKFFRNDPALLSLFTDKYSFEPNPDLQLHKIIKPELWPNVISFPVIVALHNRFRVLSLEVPYKHPAEQTALEQNSNEFRRRREVQQRNIIISSEFFVRSLLGLKTDTGRIKKVS